MFYNGLHIREGYFWGKKRKRCRKSEFASYIIVDDETMIIVEHPDFDFNLRIDAGGLGDFHSHEWRVSIDE